MGRGLLNPPTPVTVAVQGVCAEPVNGTLTGQVIVVMDGAGVIWKVTVFELAA